jgi:hypothetical protein
VASSYDAATIFESVEESYIEGVAYDEYILTFSASAIFETIKEDYQEDG